MAPLGTTAYYLPNFRAQPESTGAAIGAFGVLLLGGLFVYFLLSRAFYRRLARDTEASLRDADGPLRPGDTVITGKVSGDGDGDGPAVTVAIEQQGREWQNKGRWYHAWRERRRTVKVRPFYVVRPSGERLRVEPDERVFLVDKLDGIEPQARDRRVRTATLSAGEPVYIVGALVQGFDPQQGGYRDAGPAQVLRPPRTGHMQISTEPPAQRFYQRARVHKNLAIASLMALLVTHGALFLRHHALMVAGSRVDAQVVSSRTFRVCHKPRRSSGYWVHHWEVTAADPRSTFDQLVDETSRGAWEQIRAGALTTVPFVVLGPFSQIGYQPTERTATLALFSVGALMFALTCLLILAGSLPWYERRRVVDSGSGPLSPDTVKLR